MSERDVQDSLKFMREKLRKERKAQNMSQLTLSAEADLACNTICRIEKGTAEPGIGNLLRLTDALHIPMSELFPQGEGPKAKEIGIIDDAQLQEIISLWHKIPGEARGSAYVMIKGMLIAAQQLPQKEKGMARIWFWSKITINGMKEMAISTFAS